MVYSVFGWKISFRKWKSGNIRIICMHAALLQAHHRTPSTSPYLEESLGGKALPADSQAVQSPYHSVVDLRSVARPSTATPSCAMPVPIERTAAKMQRLLGPTPPKATPSKAPEIAKPVRRSLDGEFQNSEHDTSGSALMVGETW